MEFVGTECLHNFIDNIADPDTLVNCIVSAAQRLDMSGARLDMFGVQFIQMGTEDDTKSILQILGDDFGVKHNVGVCGY